MKQSKDIIAWIKKRVFELDGHCMNPFCPACGGRSKQCNAHRILFGNRGNTRYEVDNCITLCTGFTNSSHFAVHNGIEYGGLHMTGDEYMLFILNQLYGKPGYRWEEARQALMKIVDSFKSYRGHPVRHRPQEVASDE